MHLSENSLICVVGAGQMGAGIAQVCAQGGYVVVLVDAAIERAQAGKAGIEKQLIERALQLAKGNKAKAARLLGLTDRGHLGAGPSRHRGSR